MFLLYWILKNGYLVYAVSDQCQQEWDYIFESQTNYTIPRVYNNMYQYSGLTINDLGKYKLCNDIPTARYVLFSVLRAPPIFKAMCGPIVCTKEDYQDLGVSLFGPISYTVVFPHKYQLDHYTTLTSSAIAVIAFSLFLLFLCILATVFGLLLKEEDKESTKMKYFLAFDLYKNAVYLVSSRENKIKNFDILDGLRAISIFWVVHGHVFLIYISTVPIVNTAELFSNFAKDWVNAIWTGGTYSVDTFLWLSGFLASYFYLIVIQTNKVSIGSVLTVYAYRFARILPLYIYVIATTWSLFRYLGSGPFWYEVNETYIDDCNDYWYSNILFLNNYIPEGRGNTCIGQSWYLAVDTQLFLFAPLILIFYEKVSYYIGWILVVLLKVGGLVASAVVVIYYNLKVVQISADNTKVEDGERVPINTIYYYIKPYGWIAPYYTGVVCGMIMFALRNKELGKKYDRHLASIVNFFHYRFARYAAFVLGSGILIGIYIVKYDQYRDPGESMDFNKWGDDLNHLFIIVNHYVFLSGLCLFVMPMLLGYFPIFIDFFSLGIWKFISKLSFVIYLIHTQVIEIILGSSQSSIDISYYDCFRDTFVMFIICTLISIPIALIVELPSSNLIRIFLANRKPAKKDNEEDELTKKKLLEDN